jgi:hypothetical protein
MSPNSSFAENAGLIEVGTCVRHLGRLDVGEGRITKIYPDGNCDAEFAGCTFSWIPPSSFCSVEVFNREQMQKEEQARVALEQATAREAQIALEKAARQDLVRKIRSGRLLNDEEWVVLRGLSVREQLGIFATAKSVEFLMDDLGPLLRRASAESSLGDAVAAFWKVRAPTTECLALMPLAPSWWKERLWRVVRYAHLPLQGKLKTLSDNALQISDGLRRELIQEIVKTHGDDESLDEALAQASTRVRFEVLVNIDGSLLPRFKNSSLQLLVDVASTGPNNFSPDLIDEFWIRHEASISRNSPLFSLAPLRIKRQILRRHFHDHLMWLNRLFRHNSATSGDWHSAVVYGELDVDDRKLAKLWSSDPVSSHEFAKMLSARAAEKVAAWFYVHLGFETVDVAKHQLSGKSDDWKTHDLLLNGSKPVDVKNARLPVNSKAFYVEHTVPRFKRNRRGRDVTIAAVVSPYLSLAYMLDLDSAPFEVSDVRYLGETSLDKVSQLCAVFSSNALTVQDPADGAFLPPWYFDFPDAWYREFESICAQLLRTDSPDENEMRLLYGNDFRAFPIPKYLAAQIALPNWVLEGMAPWMRVLVSKIQSACTPRPRLAHLFLLLLTDFLSQIQEDCVEFYEPSAYLRVLFEECASPESPASRRPLGIEDPLGTIRTLCESLQQLWIARAHLELGRFAQYRLSGGGILQGRVRQDLPWETVLAYCGGRIDGKGRCGCSPLILGVESQCPACRKLICRSCGYCSESCKGLPAEADH